MNHCLNIVPVRKNKLRAKALPYGLLEHNLSSTGDFLHIVIQQSKNRHLRKALVTEIRLE